ncbi:MAG: energy transducer TonB, partial [bacterium]
RRPAGRWVVPSESADTLRVSRWFRQPRPGRRTAERPVEQAEVPPAPPPSEAEAKQSQSRPAVPDAPAELIDMPSRENAPDDSGTAILRVMVQADGTVSNVLVKRSSGSKAVDDFAVGLARKARYRPAVRAGQPAAAWLDLPVTNRPAKPGRSDRPEQPGQDQ